MEDWKKIIRETIEGESMGPRKLYNSPGEVTKKLDSIVPPNPDDPNNPALRNKKALISIGYITDAKTRIEMPNKIKRRNLATNRERSYNDYSELGEGIAGLVCVTCYNYNYQHSSFVNYDYSTRYIPQRDALRVKYGIPAVKKKDGIEGNPGEKMVDPDEIPQNMASELHKKRYYYPIDLNGRVLRGANKKPLAFDEATIAQFVKRGDPRDAYEGVTALKKIQNDNKIIDQYVDEYKALKMVYKKFKAPHVLYISGYDKVNGEKFGYVNPQAIRSVSDIDINPQDFYEIGYERYRLAFKKFDEQQAAQQAAQEEPAMAMSTESRNMTMKLTESELKQLIRESVISVLKETIDGKKIIYNGDGDNSEEWFEAGLTPYDFELIPDREVARFHSSRVGYTIMYEDEEFGEAWLEGGNLLRGNSDHEVFGGYLKVFEGYGTDGLLEDIMDKVASAILYPDDEEEDEEEYDF